MIMTATFTPSPDDAAASAQFFSELLNAHETLQDIVLEYGQATLVDAMYLMDALLRADVIDVFQDDVVDPNDTQSASRIMDLVARLPSRARWQDAIRIHDDAAPSPTHP